MRKGQLRRGYQSAQSMAIAPNGVAAGIGCPGNRTAHPQPESRHHESLSPAGGKAQSFTLYSVRRTSHPQVVHNVALVLGGGGAAGNAWAIGIIAGLTEAGLDMTEAADLVVGTSSGATAAAQVRSGMPPAELLASVLSPPAQPAGQNREQPPSLPMATVFERMRAIGRRHLGSRSTTCDGRVRAGERLRTRTRGGTAAARN